MKHRIQRLRKIKQNCDRKTRPLNTQMNMEFNGVLPALREIELGVPQGSVIGPLLFILYINEIGGTIIHSQVNLSADDTLLSVSGENVDDGIIKMQEDLNELSKWLKFNKLKLNVAKTKYMIITSRRRNT
jgi:Reverse transcriptase (RNA-dependent DNA polymerase)